MDSLSSEPKQPLKFFSSYPTDEASYGGQFQALAHLVGGTSKAYFTNVVTQQFGLAAPRLFMDSGFAAAGNFLGAFEALGPEIAITVGVTTGLANAKGYMVYGGVADGMKPHEQVDFVAKQISQGYEGKNYKLVVIWSFHEIYHSAAFLCRFWKRGVRNTFFTMTSWHGNLAERSVITTALDGADFGTKHGCTYEEQQAGASYLVQADASYAPSAAVTDQMTCAPDYTPYQFIYTA